MNVFISETPLHSGTITPQVVIHTGEFAESFGYMPKAMVRVLALAMSSNDIIDKEDKESIFCFLTLLENMIPVDYSNGLTSESGMTYDEVVSKLQKELAEKKTKKV